MFTPIAAGYIAEYRGPRGVKRPVIGVDESGNPLVLDDYGHPVVANTLPRFWGVEPADQT